MDLKHFSFTGNIYYLFPVNEGKQIYGFVKDYIVVIDSIKCKIIEYINISNFYHINNNMVKYAEDKKSFFISNPKCIYKFDIDTREVEEIFTVKNILEKSACEDISNDGRIVVSHPFYGSPKFFFDEKLIEIGKDIYDIGVFDNEYNYYYVETINKKHYIKYINLQTQNIKLSKCLKAFDNDVYLYIQIDSKNSQIFVHNINICRAYDKTTLKFKFEIKKIKYISDKYIISIFGCLITSYTLENEKISSFEIFDSLEEYRYIIQNDLIIAYPIIDPKLSIKIYDIKKGYLGRFESKYSKKYLDNCILSPDNRYLYTFNDSNILITDLISLKIIDQKLAFIRGDLINSNVYSLTRNDLYDRNLLNEIFKYLPDPK